MTHLRIKRLNTLPKINVINVQLRIMTLYGMLKSGVGRSMSNDGVYILAAIPIIGRCVSCVLFTDKCTGKKTAGGRSHPLIASGGCSVYFRKALLTSMERRRVLLAGIVNVA